MWNIKLFLFISASTLFTSFKHVSARDVREGWKYVYGRDHGMHFHIASIQYTLDDISNPNASYVHFCTGSLFTHQHVVTSASCFDEFSENAKFAVNLGVSVHDARDDPSQFILVDQKIIHPEYNKENKKANVAVLILKDPIQLNYHVKPQLLIRKDAPLNGAGLLVGWNGRVRKSQKKLSKKLLKAHASVLSRNECESYYPNLLDDQFCVGGLEISTAPCGGTPGIPYMLIMQRLRIAGVATHWPENCEGPALFTAFSKYLDFLTQYYPKKW